MYLELAKGADLKGPLHTEVTELPPPAGPALCYFILAIIAVSAQVLQKRAKHFIVYTRISTLHDLNKVYILFH